MTKCRKSWRVRFKAILLGLVALAGCSEPKNLPPVTPATSQDIQKLTRNSDAKAVLVNMWASWCGPCREEFPDLVKLQRDYEKRGLKVVFVSWDDRPEDAARFLARQG